MNSIIFSTLTQNCFNDVDILLISDILFHKNSSNVDSRVFFRISCFHWNM